MMDMQGMVPTGIFEGLIGTVLTIVTSILGYLHKSVSNRMSHVEELLNNHMREIDTKTNRKEVKEIIEDKLAPIQVTLQDIKRDLDEIGKDLKTLTRSYNQEHNNGR